jgi:hypothetical protein
LTISHEEGTPLDRQASTPTAPSTRGQRLKVFGRAATGRSAAPARGTTVERHALAPAVAYLLDAPIIAVYAPRGNDFRVTIAGDRILGNPAHPTDGQKIVFHVTQGGRGHHGLRYGSAYQFGAGLPRPTLSTAPGHTDLLAFIYNAAKGKWLFVAFVKGFGWHSRLPFDIARR